MKMLTGRIKSTMIFTMSTPIIATNNNSLFVAIIDVDMVKIMVDNFTSQWFKRIDSNFTGATCIYCSHSQWNIRIYTI